MNAFTTTLGGLGLLALSACNTTPMPDPIVCSGTGADSQGSSGGISYLIEPLSAAPVYHVLTSPRLSAGGYAVSVDYMVHEPVTPPAKALLVLIPGGGFDAGLSGTDGSNVDTASANFLVRSSHLFAQHGYRVVTMDRPDDYWEFMAGGSENYRMDGYRTSQAHAIDLAAIVDAVNASDHLPVILLGTSRGAISAVAQANLFSAIGLSSPVTGGSNGDPVSHADAARVSVPVQVLWHDRDACNVTVPVNSYTLSDAFANGEGVGVSGGFSPYGTRDCGATSYHGFLGIESCAVGITTDWLDALPLAATAPGASVVNAGTVTAGSTTVINLTGAGSQSVAGTLSYSLPYASSNRGGTVSINGNNVSYTPSGTGADSFVYVVKENGGGTAFNIVKLNVVY